MDHRRPALPGLLLACLLCSAAPFAAGQSSLIARQTPTGSFDLLAVDELTASVAVAEADVDFLAVALQGVPATEQLRLDRARTLGGPAPAVRLPALGSLCRVGSSGWSAWLQVSTDGSTTRWVETADVGGPAVSADVAVAPDGQRALVCTTLGAGGNVWLLDLATGVPTELTSTLPSLSVDGISLRLGPDTAWFVASGQLYRVDLPAGLPAAVPLPLGPGEILQGELAMSRDGHTVAVVSELTPLSRRLFIVSHTGTVTEAPGGPADFDLPSYPSIAGPLLVLSDDGSCVAWRRTVLVKELFTFASAQPGSVQQVTADAQFTDTLDIVGVLGFIGPTVLSFFAGEAPGPLEPDVALGSADLYITDVTSGATSNVSLTSGEALPPFLTAGEIELKRAFFDPQALRMLLQVDPDNGDHGLLAVPLDGSQGVSTVLDDLVDGPTLVPVGSRLLIPSHFDTGGPGAPGQQLHLLDTMGSPSPLTLLGLVPEGVQVDRFASSRDGSTMACVASAAPAFELIVWIDATTATVFFAWPDVLAVSPALGFSPSGRLLAGLGLPGGPYVFASFDAPLSGSLAPVPIGNGYPLNP